MKFFCLIITLMLLNMLSAKAQQQRAKIDTVFFEDFNQKTIDRSKWNIEVTGHTNNDEQQAYVDSASTLYLTDGKAEGAKNGALIIKPIYHQGYQSKEGNKYDFLSARINTESKVEFTYGSASAKMKMSGGAGLWPAFWALGTGKWPDCGEIDVMETIGDSSWISNAIHGPGYFGNTPIVYRTHFPKGVDVTRWHIYSVDWTANSMIFKLDGQITYTVTRAMIEKYGKWAFDTTKHLILNFALGGGYPHGENKVNTPYYGLPQVTVDKIKAGQAEAIVDWVLITKPAK